MTAKRPDPPPLVPAPATLAALAHDTRPDLDQDAVHRLIIGAITAGVPWARILCVVPRELADRTTTMHDLSTVIYADRPGRAPRTT